MLESLEFHHVGPASHLTLELRERLNFLTGDNGLGKSFLLDAAWWALTRTWARTKIVPHRPPSKPSIAYRYTTNTDKTYGHVSEFDRSREEWPLKKGRPLIPGIVLYAQVDGGFSVWDPARNYWKGEQADRPSAYLFSPEELCAGLPLRRAVKLCNGLIGDWANWQLEGAETFQQLTRVLEVLAPSPQEPLTPGNLAKVSLLDARRHPTLRTAYGQEVPLIHASAGMRRIVALAYLLVWSWNEHVAAAKLRGDSAAREVVFLIDEVEAHLHPQWQRRIVPALLSVVDALAGKHGPRVQLITATHSPLVLASAEPFFDHRHDAWFDLDLEERRVVLRQRDFVRLSDVGGWLTSEAFGLREARSVEAEDACREAQRAKAGDPGTPKQRVARKRELRRQGRLNPGDRR